MNSGLIVRLGEDTIFHSCNTDAGSSGGPILLLDNQKVIGFNKGSKSDLNANMGEFIKHPIVEFIKKNIGH